MYLLQEAFNFELKHPSNLLNVQQVTVAQLRNAMAYNVFISF